MHICHFDLDSGSNDYPDSVELQVNSAEFELIRQTGVDFVVIEQPTVITVKLKDTEQLSVEVAIDYLKDGFNIIARAYHLVKQVDDMELLMIDFIEGNIVYKEMPYIKDLPRDEVKHIGLQKVFKMIATYNDRVDC